MVNIYSIWKAKVVDLFKTVKISNAFLKYIQICKLRGSI